MIMYNLHEMLYKVLKLKNKRKVIVMKEKTAELQFHAKSEMYCILPMQSISSIEIAL